jgi:TonB family protein
MSFQMMNKLKISPAPSAHRPAFTAFSTTLLIAAFLALGVAAHAQDSAPAQPAAAPPASSPAAKPDAAPQPDVPWTTAPADQTPAQQAPATQPLAPPPATAPAADAQPAPATAEPAPEAAPAPNYPGEISESAIKQLLVGKPLILRDGYQDDDLRFNENGQLIDRSPKGSFTLSGIQITRVRLTKHKLELEGDRYGLRFSSSLQSRDPNESAERVKITPKKKTVKITIDRELVITPKKEKEKKKKGATPAVPAKPAQVAAAQPVAEPAAPPVAAPPAAPATDADEAKAQIAAAPAAERPADPNSVTTTNSPQHANALLRKAIDRIFSQGIDDRLIASMPPYWRIYYQAIAAGKDFHSDDPAVLRQGAVETKAHLVSIFEAKSNDYAQAHDVAGMEELHAVVGADGKVRDVVISQPIGFGLDENAVDSVRKATFEPAMKDGKPVPVELDLVVQFHIYSKLTSNTANPDEAQKAAPQLPGPYSLKPAAEPH